MHVCIHVPCPQVPQGQEESLEDTRARHLCACSLTSIWNPFTCQLQQALPVEYSLLEEPLRELDSVWNVKVLGAAGCSGLSAAHMHTRVLVHRLPAHPAATWGSGQLPHSRPGARQVASQGQMQLRSLHLASALKELLSAPKCGH